MNKNSIKSFFSKVDEEIRKDVEKKASDDASRAENAEFFKKVLTEFKPMFNEYLAELKKRNISIVSTIDEAYLSLRLNYKDGGHHSIIFKQGSYGHYEFVSFFTNDDGQEIRSESGKTYSKKNWNNSELKENIEECIQNFLYYSDRHAG
jgi:hypothetical protein